MADDLGQVPTPDSGQVPVADPPAGSVQEPDGQEPKGAKKKYDEDYVKGIRDEAAKYRTQAKQFETRIQQLEQASLSEQERKDQESARLQKIAATWETERTELVVSRELERAAVRVGATKPEAIYKLADLTRIEFEDGKPTRDSIQTVIDTAMADYPEFFKSTTPAPTPPPASGGGVNAPKQGPGLTREAILKMTTEQAAAMWASGEMDKAIRAGILNK